MNLDFIDSSAGRAAKGEQQEEQERQEEQQEQEEQLATGGLENLTTISSDQSLAELASFKA